MEGRNLREGRSSRLQSLSFAAIFITMLKQVEHWRPRDLRFLSLVALTCLVGAIYLNEGLRLAEQEGSGWRRLDLDALMRREAEWYHPATEKEARGLGGTQ